MVLGVRMKKVSLSETGSTHTDREGLKTHIHAPELFCFVLGRGGGGDHVDLKETQKLTIAIRRKHSFVYYDSRFVM